MHLANDKNTIIAIVLFIIVALSSTTETSHANISVDSSGNIPEIANNDYNVENLLDKNITTAWCSDGNKTAKPWFSIVTDDSAINGIVIFNGYTKNEKTFKNNARVKTVSLYSSGRMIGRFTLKDSMLPQLINMKNLSKNKEYYFYIEDAYPGEKYKDICLSEISFDTKIIDAMEKFHEFDRLFIRESMGRDEIYKYFKSIYDIYKIDSINENEIGHSKLSDSLYYRLNNQDSMGLRLILDMSYYEINYSKPINIDFTETLNDLIIEFIINKPEIVLSVFNDDTQLMRWGIVSAYEMYISSISPDEKREMMSSSGNFRKLSLAIEGSQIQIQ